MGFRITRYTVNNIPGNAQVELDDLLLCDDNRSVLHGRVVDCAGLPVANAVVKIFSAPAGVDVCDAPPEFLTPEGHVFTDSSGQFIFPVCPTDRVFLIKIFALETAGIIPATATPCPTLFPCCTPTCPGVL